MGVATTSMREKRENRFEYHIEISQITVYFTGTFYIEIPVILQHLSVCTVSSCVGAVGGGAH